MPRNYERIGAPVLLATLLGAGLPALADSEEAPAPARADEILLKNGSRIIGSVTVARDGVVTVETDFAGTLEIALEDIASLRTVAPTTLLLADDSVVREQPLRIEGGEIVASAAAPARPLDELAVVNPEPWELGQGYRWTGLINFAWLLERGNTDSDELDYKLESTWRSVRDRYRLLARGENDESEGVKTSDSWLVRGKWDYFLTDPNYWGLLGQAERDKFADVDLRWLAGPFFGRQFFDDPPFALSAELGVSYVSEEYFVAEDQEYGAGNWDLDITSDLLGGDSRLYLHQFGIWNLENTSDVVVDTTLGLGFPLLFGFEAAAEILWEYDSGAPNGVDELDETYSIRIGYAW